MRNHRNGIKKTRRPLKMSMEGMNCRFVRNQAQKKILKDLERGCFERKGALQAFAKRGMQKLTEEEKASQS